LKNDMKIASHDSKKSESYRERTKTST